MTVLINPPVFEHIKNQNKHFATHLDGAAKASFCYYSQVVKVSKPLNGTKTKQMAELRNCSTAFDTDCAKKRYFYFTLINGGHVSKDAAS